MTLGNLLSQMGIGPKQLSERYSHADFGGQAHDPHLLYSYEPAPASHGHVASSKHHHHYSSGGHKSNAAMSALTLLAFLFFLHILQQCLKDHMNSMSTPPVMIMTAGREGEEPLQKSAVNKIDKSAKHSDVEANSETSNHHNFNFNAKSVDDDEKDALMKINTAEYTPKSGVHKIYKNVYSNYGNRSLPYPGFVSVMDNV